VKFGENGNDYLVWTGSWRLRRHKTCWGLPGWSKHPFFWNPTGIWAPGAFWILSITGGSNGHGGGVVFLSGNCPHSQTAVLPTQLTSFFFFFFFFFFPELGIEPRALRLLGKCSTTEPNPQPRLLPFPWLPFPWVLEERELEFPGSTVPWDIGWAGQACVLGARARAECHGTCFILVTPVTPVNSGSPWQWEN